MEAGNTRDQGKKAKDKYISSPLNYTGGKFRLLPQILPLFPSDIDTFVDLFCGGCNVGINVSAKKHIYNDIDENVTGLIRYFSKCDPSLLLEGIRQMISLYDLSDSTSHPYEYYGCKGTSGLGDYNRAGFLRLREDFNRLTAKDSKYYEMFYLLIVFAFNNQIRFNSSGCYNLPVGKRDFNKNMQKKLLRFIEALKQQNAVICSKRFQSFKAADLKKCDFVYADPPYLITDATYNEQSGWTEKDEEILLDYLSELDENGIRFALSNVLSHKGKENSILKEWISRKDFTVHHLEYNYSNANYHTQRTKDSDEVLITNY